MRLFLDFPLDLGHEFRYKTVDNFKRILEQYNESMRHFNHHVHDDEEAHKAEQITYITPKKMKTTVQKELTYQDARIRNAILGVIGDGTQEVIDARVGIDGTIHPLLSDRLRHDIEDIDNRQRILEGVEDDNTMLFYPPTPSTAVKGRGETPSTDDPDTNLKVYWDKFVDNSYVKKRKIGNDQSQQYNVYSYTFEPTHYSKTMIVTSCIHGNEKSAFFALSKFMDLVVNEWHKYPQLAYLRKNVRMVFVPIVNPHGFANDNRENVNNVDLNRNFDYYWENGGGTDPSASNFKGTKPFSEQESKNMRDLIKSYSGVVAHIDCHNIVSQVSDYCVFYPRFANQQNNEIFQTLKDMSKQGDYVTWGSSTLSSFSNWVGINADISSYLPEVYEGRAGERRGAGEMRRSMYFLGNLIIRASRFSEIGLGRTSNEPFAKAFVYNDRYNGTNTPKLSLNATSKYQRLLMTQQRFKTLANGFCELNGSITVELTKDTTFGVNPSVVQNYNPFSGNGKSRRRQLFLVEHTLPAGIHTIPIHAIAPIQASTDPYQGVNRTNEIMPTVEVFRGEGYTYIRSLILNVTFTPSHSHNAVQIFTSTQYGNQKEGTFEQIYPNRPAAYDARNDIIHKN